MTSENTTMMVVKEDLAGGELLDQLKNPNGQIYCSMKNDGTRKSAVKIYNAISSAEKNIADMINMTLDIVNVVAHPITLTDEVTGETVTALRTVLVDKDGVGYAAVSGGIANSLSRIFSIVGMPDNNAWEKEPVKMKIKQVKTRDGVNSVLTIELV